ncbi:MAG: SigE family RNA polymerase sigma factor [Actinomycetota bacterium]
MRRARERDEQFGSFFLAESERLRRLGVWLTGDPERAADLAQEALARTFRHWRRIREQDPAPYARRILVNLVRSQHRRTLLERRHEQKPDGFVAGEATRVDEWLRITEALKALPPMRRATIVLRFYEDMSEADIARALDRPLGTVKSDIHRALAKLRPLLEETERERA